MSATNEQHEPITTIELDIVLGANERIDSVQDFLRRSYGVVTELDPVHHNCHPTLLVTGTAAQLRRVRRWHNAPRGYTRPDLTNKPPVARGERRT